MFSLEKLLNKWPGKRIFGIYRFLPVFFTLGAVLEFSMINWTAGATNFYLVYKNKQAKVIAQQQLDWDEYMEQYRQHLEQLKTKN